MTFRVTWPRMWFTMWIVVVILNVLAMDWSYLIGMTGGALMFWAYQHLGD